MLRQSFVPHKKMESSCLFEFTRIGGIPLFIQDSDCSDSVLFSCIWPFPGPCLSGYLHRLPQQTRRPETQRAGASRRQREENMNLRNGSTDVLRRLYRDCLTVSAQEPLESTSRLSSVAGPRAYSGHTGPTLGLFQSLFSRILLLSLKPRLLTSKILKTTSLKLLLSSIHKVSNIYWHQLCARSSAKHWISAVIQQHLPCLLGPQTWGTSFWKQQQVPWALHKGLLWFPTECLLGSCSLKPQPCFPSVLPDPRLCPHLHTSPPPSVWVNFHCQMPYYPLLEPSPTKTQPAVQSLWCSCLPPIISHLNQPTNEWPALIWRNEQILGVQAWN